ncbi:MAG: hypothetical protein ACRCTT_11200 [Enterobacter roggenkampii]
MFILHIDLPLSIGEPRPALLTDIFEAPSFAVHASSRHQSDFTATYLMQLQAAKKRRRQRSRSTLSCPMNLKKRS